MLILVFFGVFVAVFAEETAQMLHKDPHGWKNQTGVVRAA